MENTFLFEIIRALYPTDGQAILRFLKSPFFNDAKNAQELCALYEAIVSLEKKGNAVGLRKEILYKKVFPGQKMVDGKLEKLKTDLKKMLQQYLFVSSMLDSKNEASQKLAWLNWLRRLNWEDRFMLEVAKVEKSIDDKSKQGLEMSFKLAETIYEWENDHNQFTSDLRIPGVLKHLDKFYLVYRADLENRFLLQKKNANLINVFGVNSEASLYESDTPLLYVLNRINELLRKENPAPEDVTLLAKILYEYKDRVDTELIANYSAYLRNLCTMLIDKGHIEFVPILHQMHRDGIDGGTLLADGKIGSNSYLNIVQVAIRANNVDWADAFTEQYRDAIMGGDAEQHLYMLNRAYCLFAKGAYEEAIGQLPDVSNTTHLYLLVRRLEIKAYFELDSDLLSYKIDSFRKFIQRTAPKMLSETVREMNLNFLLIITQILQAPIGDEARSERILKRIAEKQHVCERVWLMEKAKNI